MISDLNRVDFANVQEQASWVCQCDESLVSRLELDFKNTLQSQVLLLLGCNDVIMFITEFIRAMGSVVRRSS